MASISPLATLSQEPEAPATAGQAEIDLLMRRFFEQTQGEVTRPVQPGPPAQSVQSSRDFDMAIELLERAAQGFDLLVSRCQRLEKDLEQETERATAHAAQQNEAIEQWKRLASGLKDQAEALEQETATLKQRCVAAEARAGRAEAQVTALEKASAEAASQAALAEQLSTKLHDKVVTAFGIGSRAHPVLEAVATQIAAE